MCNVTVLSGPESLRLNGWSMNAAADDDVEVRGTPVTLVVDSGGPACCVWTRSPRGSRRWPREHRSTAGEFAPPPAADRLECGMASNICKWCLWRARVALRTKNGFEQEERIYRMRHNSLNRRVTKCRRKAVSWKPTRSQLVYAVNQSYQWR